MLTAACDRAGVPAAAVQDIAVGNVQQSGAYAAPARMAMLRAGFPASVPLYAVNRQCSSGLQAVANVASSIHSGNIQIGLAAGVESMSNGGAPGKGAGDPPPANWGEIMGKIRDDFFDAVLITERASPRRTAQQT